MDYMKKISKNIVELDREYTPLYLKRKDSSNTTEKSTSDSEDGERLKHFTENTNWSKQRERKMQLKLNKLKFRNKYYHIRTLKALTVGSFRKKKSVPVTIETGVPSQFMIQETLSMIAR